jgi:hypothetical protein
MNDPHVCMFCRYRKSRARDLEACCAGAELLASQPNAAENAPRLAARGMPERLRYPAPRPPETGEPRHSGR